MKVLSLDVLTKSQNELLPKLKFLKNKNFYLAGGTGLALQLGHRTSADFDFYSATSFDSEVISLRIRETVKKSKLIRIRENTLIMNCDGILTSFFFYPYRLLKPLLDLGDVWVASIEDISAMKLVAIIQRGTKRDFIDIYYLIKKLGLGRMLELSKQKYKEFNQYLALQALLYFEDADREKLSIRKIRIKERLDWNQVKNFIIAEVKKVKEMLK